MPKAQGQFEGSITKRGGKLIFVDGISLKEVETWFSEYRPFVFIERKNMLYFRTQPKANHITISNNIFLNITITATEIVGIESMIPIYKQQAKKYCKKFL